MLTRTRQEEILKLVNEKQSVTVNELVMMYHASESTIRRDIVFLDSKGLLTKVFGGAVRKKKETMLEELTVLQKKPLHVEAKINIGRYAATLIEPHDLVFLDAGTTIGHMVDFIEEKTATYVTNSIEQARKLMHRGFSVILIGGALKSSTEAIVGAEAILNIQKYHFTKGFFATNAVHPQYGFTTPDINEASTKTAAIKNTKKAFMLCDDSKFHQTQGISFAEGTECTILTNRVMDGMEVDMIVCEQTDG